MTYADVENAPAVVLVGLEPEEECPILFLRLRKAYLKKKLTVYAIAPFATRGLEKLGAKLARVGAGRGGERARRARHGRRGAERRRARS